MQSLNLTQKRGQLQSEACDLGDISPERVGKKKTSERGGWKKANAFRSTPAGSKNGNSKQEKGE